MISSQSLGPNIGKDERSYFQSDKDLEIQASRTKKQQQFIHLGNPFKVTSKILNFAIGNDFVYLAESSFIVEELDLDNGLTGKKFRGHNGPVTDLVVLKDLNLLVTSSWDKTIKTWDLKTDVCLLTISVHTDFVKVIRVSGNFIYSGSADKSICCTNLMTGNLVKSFQGHTRSVEDLVISPDGATMYSAGSDGVIRKWDTEAGEQLQIFDGHETSIYNLYPVWSEDILWSVSADKSAIKWDLATGKIDSRLNHPDFVKSIVALPSGHVITGCRDENIRIWDSAGEKLLSIISAHFGEVSSLAYEGSRIFSGSHDCTFRQWNLPELLNNFQITEVPEKVQGSILTEEEERELEDLMHTE